MRLLVSCVPFDGGKSGLSVYAREVVRELRAQGHGLTVLTRPDGNPVVSMLWHLLVLPLWITWRRRDFDGFVICAANRRVCAWYPLPTVATVHDLANFHVPGKYSRLRMFYLAHVLPFFAKRAHRLVAVSGATKADMVTLWHCRPGAVTVLYNGVAATVAAGSRPPARAAGSGCILYVSRIEHPGKNHVRLIEAYGRLPRALAERHPLVLAGADWKDAAAVHAAAAQSPHADLIRFAGFAPDEELARLWDDAAAYVFPSLFEGFGLSLVEAMARGIPCACSANGSLGEIAGDAAVTFDPADAGAIADALERLLTEPPDARAARVARGYARAKQFSWADHARGIVAELRKSAVFGVRIDCDTCTEAVAAVKAGGGRFFAFVNAHCLNVAYADAAYRDILNGQCDRVWPDGVGVKMAGRRLGFAVPENVNGTDLFPKLASAGGLSFWFLGGEPGVAAEALRRCAAAYPQSRFLGATDGFRTDWGEAVAEIAAAKPDVLLVALGVPLQEKWVAAHRRQLHGVGCIVAVGGLLDFLSGRIPRAPVWMRRCGLEWIWRLMMEPRRKFRRYVVGNLLFLHRVAKERRGMGRYIP